jgi:hypothetical protein
MTPAPVNVELPIELSRRVKGDGCAVATARPAGGTSGAVLGRARADVRSRLSQNRCMAMRAGRH